MSTKENNIFIEDAIADFEVKDGIERIHVLRRLEENGFSLIVPSFIEQWEKERAQFLEEYDITEAEIVRDGAGNEVFFTANENGNPDEPGYSISTVEVKVPDYLDVAGYVNRHMGK